MDDRQEIQSILQQGIDDYLVKPFKKNRLLDTVTSLVGPARPDKGEDTVADESGDRIHCQRRQTVVLPHQIDRGCEVCTRIDKRTVEIEDDQAWTQGYRFRVTDFGIPDRSENSGSEMICGSEVYQRLGRLADVRTARASVSIS